MYLLLAVIGISLAVSFLCSILEAVFLSITQSHIMVLNQNQPRIGKILLKLRKNIDEPIAAILTLNTVSHTIGAAVSGAMALELFGEAYLAAFSAALTVLILVFSEILPKTLGARFWRALTPLTTVTLRFLIVVLKPLLIPLAFLNRLISPAEKSATPSISRADLAILANIGRREGSLDLQEWQFVTGAVKMSEVRAREIMIPRVDIVAISKDVSLEEAKQVMLTSGYFRLPVYSGSIDNVLGVIVARDLFTAVRRGKKTVEEIIRETLFVPETKSIGDLLSEMRSRKVKMAVVIDEFGGTSGILTVEDLVEQIVGDLRDEHEAQPQGFKTLPDGAVSMAGWSSIDEVNLELGLELDNELYDTIGGYVFGKLGRVPLVGDSVSDLEGTFTVTDMDGSRVSQVRFNRAQEQA